MTEHIEIKRAALSNLVEQKIKAFQKRRVEKKWKATGFRGAIIFLSGATTVVVGLDLLALDKYSNNIALLTSSFVTMLTAFETYKNPHELYVQYTKTVSQLYDIQNELNYQFVGDSNTWDAQRLDGLFEEFERVMSDVRETWVKAKQVDVSDTK